MNQLKRILAIGLIAIPLALTGACGSNNSGGGGGGGVPQTVDIALGDQSYTLGTPAIYLWLDVLANSGPNLPDPDITLDVGTRNPTRVYFYNGDLYVAAASSSESQGGLLIYRDYLNLADGASPDVVVYDAAVPTNGPETLQRLAIENNVLVGSTWYTPVGLYFWDNASDIADGQAPDVFMDDTTLGLTPNFLNCAQDVILHNGMLIVASCDSGTDVAVGIWNDVQDILSGGDATAPDVMLTDDDNFLGIGNGMRALTTDDNGALYVSEYYGYTIYKFNDVTAIDGSSLPDVVITGGGDQTTENSDLDTPNHLLVVNNTLFVANRTENLDFSNNPGVVGYKDAANLGQNQAANIRLTRDVGMASADRLATAGGALFISGAYLDFGAPYDPFNAFYIYRDASSIATGVSPDFALVGDPDVDISFVENPMGIAATVRGTFDNFIDNGT